MVFKENDKKTKEAGRRGAISRLKLHGNKHFTKYQFKKGDKWSLECAAKGIKIAIKNNPGLQKRAGRLSRYNENRVAKKIKGDYIFQPNEVCDRIVVTDKKVCFVEIKKKGKKLREKQELFRKIVGNKYKIIYYEQKKGRLIIT